MLSSFAKTTAAVVSTLSASLSTVMLSPCTLASATASVVCEAVVEDASSALLEIVLPVKVEAELESEG